MNAADERARSLRAQLKDEGLLTPEIAAQLEVPWRTNGVIVQVVFFLLACLGLVAFHGLVHVFDVPRPGIVTGIAAIAVAEFLIRVKRWYATGVEVALWVGGLAGFISELPSKGTPESLLVIAAAFAIPGFRVRNPIAGGVAAVLVAVYFEQRFDLGVIAALAIAATAMLLLLRTWQRPTTEWLLIAIALVLPIAGRFMADDRWQTMTILLYTVFGSMAFALALTKRHHAFFLGALIAFAIAGIDVARTIAAPEEAKLAVAGAALLSIAFFVTRMLRNRTTGFVTTKTKYDTTLETIVTIANAPQPTPSPAPLTGDGRFGGAGASGGY